MKDAQKKTWILEHRCKCDDAIRAIEAAKRQSASAYDARLRKLNAFAEVLFVKNADTSQLELFEPEQALSDDIAELLKAPLGGL